MAIYLFGDTSINEILIEDNLKRLKSDHPKFNIESGGDIASYESYKRLRNEFTSRLNKKNVNNVLLQKPVDF